MIGEARIFALFLSLVALTHPAESQTASGRSGSATDWKIEASAWIQNEFFRQIKHPVFGRGYATNYGRVLFVKLHVRAQRPLAGALNAWKSALPQYWNSLFILAPRLCKPSAGSYRLFDSTDILLDGQKPAVVATLAEQMFGGVDAKSARGTLAYSPPPAGLLCSIGFDGGERLIGLVRLGADAEVTVAFSVPEEFSVGVAKVVAFGIPVALREVPTENLNDAALRLDWFEVFVRPQ